METIHDIATLRETLRTVQRHGKRIVAVPTMGNLHEGHLALVDRARQYGDYVVATIFVNPMQFGEGEDFESYPRTLEADTEKLRARGCDCVFAPSAAEIYPEGLKAHTVVSVPGISERHCGASRPGHFDGVATVVAKLFGILQPDAAVFGLKDYQQFQVIRKMVLDLCLPVELIGVATQRDENGLALSSRNHYLTQTQRHQATRINRCLRHTVRALQQGHRDFARLEQQARDALSEEGLEVDYFTICQAGTLEPATAADHDLVVLAAARIGGTRLIDNMAPERA